MGRTRTGSTGFKAVERVSPTRQVRKQLYEAIEKGDYPAGSLLPSERQLCEAFGVSRVSVREALAGLEAVGMIEIQHGRGAVVQDISEGTYATSFGEFIRVYGDDLIELLEVRQALDELAAASAANNADDVLRQQVDSARQGFKSAALDSATTVAALAKLDEDFHYAVAVASGGSLLPDLVRELNGVLERSRELTLSQEGQLECSIVGHDAIADAILNGDPSAARLAAGEHIRQIRERVSDDAGSDPSA